MSAGSVTWPVLRSTTATFVIVSGVVSKAILSTAEKVSSLSSGSMTALTGTIGKPIGALHLPPTPADGASPRTLTSAADVHGPRLPASDSAVSLTNLADTGAKTAYLLVASSAQVPAATCRQTRPSRLTATE